MKAKILILALIVSLFIACSDNDKKSKEDANASVQASLAQGEKLDFSLDFLDGTHLNIKADSDKISFNNDKKATLFVFFTTWCIPCTAEIPHLNKLQEKYKDNFNIIAVSLEDKSNDELKSFVEKNKIIYKIANGENNYLLAKALGGVNGIPTMFLYTDNKLFNEYLGLIPEEMLEIEIQKALL